ncbi:MULTISPECIES: DUF192 domain-containing protein [unclassified Treponema]|uniref:DUF192 domain-containing protein n=1 Tax=unclassified Treponema TaxID=2638727 RepID=UPI0020A4DED3|nr:MULTISPECIES: DUF192 domain-containing protein [unclassified Treponema]UTC66979.1 DUF192 domain-containing protein [Treponema sp. OMZ 789]UTC69709.1 DUF192 domain-containing protein [Treponema sp. OMZ 790]UTC72423.1 DUF192 domain-containing protein [Treponema sp. OMZ 791]
MIFKKISVLFLILCLFPSCGAQDKMDTEEIFIEKTLNDETQDETKTEDSVKKNIEKISVELAITPSQQQKGFMERKVIPEGTGMIFLYKEDTKLRFWMKDTPHALSIAFIDSSGVIKEIYDMTPYSLETIESTYSVRYALEVPKGMFNRMNIKEGDKLTQETIFLLKRKLQ